MLYSCSCAPRLFDTFNYPDDYLTPSLSNLEKHVGVVNANMGFVAPNLTKLVSVVDGDVVADMVFVAPILTKCVYVVNDDVDTIVPFRGPCFDQTRVHFLVLPCYMEVSFRPQVPFTSLLSSLPAY